MGVNSPSVISAIAARFTVPGEFLRAEPFAGGHINDSHVLTYRQGSQSVRFLLQRLNPAIFKHPARVMENIRRVTDHIAKKLTARKASDVARRVLTLVPTPAGDSFCQDDAGACWRLYHFIEGTRVYESVQTPEQAYRAGRAFGEFQSLLADFPGPRLHEALPGFHNTPLRYAAFELALAADARNRAAAAKAEIEFVAARRPLAPVLLDLWRNGKMPERVVHNDAKISNVLLDEKTGEGLCVVDLDIVMPGLALFDFGDMMRSMTTTAAEDEPDPAKVELQMPLFEGLARGYLEAAGAFLNAVEREHLIFAGRLITLEQGVRFLTDFLNGDTYYKTQRPGQNLDRCRTQFKLVESMTRQEAALQAFVRGL